MSLGATPTEFFQAAGLLLILVALIWLAFWAALSAKARARKRPAPGTPGGPS